MKQVTQSYRTGDLEVLDVPPPDVRPGGILVRNYASLISSGTERHLLETARKSLLGKARERPDLVRQVLNKARTEGIRPTIDAVRGRLDTPIPLGYSSAGVVIKVGEGADGFRLGDRVACAGAGYAVHAEVIFVPRNLAVTIPKVSRSTQDDAKHPAGRAAGRPEFQVPAPVSGAVPFEDAAFTTLGAIALQSVRIAEARIGETVAVLGLGLVGQLAVQLLKAAGCRVLGMDPNPERCRAAELIGCDVTATTSTEAKGAAIGSLSPEGADAVILTASTESNEPVELAADLCRDKGRVVVVGLIGINVPRRPFYEKELDLRLSRAYGPGRYDPVYEEKGIDYPYGYVRWTEGRNMAAFLDLVAQGKVRLGPLATHRFPIDRAAEAYELITGDRRDEALGVVLTYPDAERDAPESGVTMLNREVRRTAGARPERVAVGLIGAGEFAKSVLLPGLKATPGVELAMVCTANGLNARYAARKFGFASCTADSGAIFGDPEIDAVVIATRHDSHVPLVVEALRAGKHVYVEKPLALNESGLGSIAKAVDAAGSNAPMVGYNRRFAQIALHLKEFVSDVREPLVLHYRVNAGYLPADHWSQDPDEGGGRIIGEVCHFVDFLIFLTGALPVRVHARATPNAGRYRNDNAAVTLEFADGSLGVIVYVANGDRGYPKERVELFGGGRVATLDDFRRLELVRDGRKTVHKSGGRQDKGHREALRAFVAAIREGRPSPVPWKEAVATSLTTFRILESLATATSTMVDAEEFMARDPAQ